jgi:hypothetical protein
VQIVEHDHHRLARRHHRQQLDDPLQKEQAFGVGVADPATITPDIRDQPCQRGTLRRAHSSHNLGVDVTDERREHLDPRLIGDPETLVGCPNDTTVPSACATRVAWATSDVLPMPASPATNTAWHCSLVSARLRAPMNASSSELRPKNPNNPFDAAPTNRPGNGTDPSTVAGSHTTSTTSSGSGRPLRSSDPRSTNDCAACRPTINRTSSAARI